MVANGDHGIICLQSKDLDIVDDYVADNMMVVEYNYKIGYYYTDLRLLMMMLTQVWIMIRRGRGG